jgi:succinyl-CoA synthetase alpha subunit
MRLSELCEYDLLALETLGGECVTAPRGTFTGIFESNFVQVGDIGVDSAVPKLTARTCDVRAAGAGIGATLGIEGETYIVRSVQDDAGMATLILEGP